MKKIILILLCSSTLMAQEFKTELVGKMLPAKVIFGDGKVKDVLMRYQPPEFFKNPANKFWISLTGSEADAYDHTGGIEAFMIDNKIWALRPNPLASPPNATNFVVLKQQGAIEKYEFITSGYKSEADYKGITTKGTFTRKLGGPGYRASEMKDEYLREWVSDSPEIVEELRQADSMAESNKMKESESKQDDASSEESSGKGVKRKGLMGALVKLDEKSTTMQKKADNPTYTDMNLIVNNYNALYDQNNAGKIKYYFVDPPTRMKSQAEASLDAQKKQASRENSEKEKAQAKTELFASRSTTPSPEIASAKENQPVKKENFAAKMQRIKGDGNKVGVIFYLKPAAIPKPSTPSTGPSMMMKQAMPSNDVSIDGEYLDESLLSLGQDFTDELNKALGTSDIELIDINEIPYKDMRMGRIDDWWATKYKVVFAYTVDPRVTLSKKNVDGKSQSVASVNMITSLLAMEYIGTSESPKQKVIAQILNMGSFVTPAYTQDDDMNDVQEIYEKILEKLGTPMVEKIKSERADAVTKLVEKKLK